MTQALRQIKGTDCFSVRYADHPPGRVLYGIRDKDGEGVGLLLRSGKNYRDADDGSLIFKNLAAAAKFYTMTPRSLREI